MSASTPRTLHDPPDQQTAKEALAEETHTSLDEIDKLYEEELSTLAADAKITQYLYVLAARRVRMKLRKPEADSG